MITLTVNGSQYQVDLEPDTPLLWALRDAVGLTGTKFGCGIAQCGACTVHINGQAMRSCSVPIGALKNASITTIEGLSPTPSTRCSRRGLPRTCRNAATASPARSWPRWRSSSATPARPMRTSMPASPTFAVAGPTNGFVVPSIAPPT